MFLFFGRGFFLFCFGGRRRLRFRSSIRCFVLFALFLLEGNLRFLFGVVAILFNLMGRRRGGFGLGGLLFLLLLLHEGGSSRDSFRFGLCVLLVGSSSRFDFFVLLGSSSGGVRVF